VTSVIPSGEKLMRWRIPAVSVGLGLASVAVIAVATVTSDHDFWVFAVWVVVTGAAIVSGLAVLFRVPRGKGAMATRRAASFGVVVAVLCATLGLAVYSQTRVHDCPTSGFCAPAAPGKGQRPQEP
jgi:hypothetical protein